MFGFMESVQNAWLEATGWNQDNSYANLNASAQALLDFPLPHGLRLNVSSLSSPNFATSYSLGSVGVVDGSLSYLYSSPALRIVSRSRDAPLRTVIQGYRQLRDLPRPDSAWAWEIWQRGKRIDKRDALLYGRLYLPSSTLEALYLRRLSPTRQLQLSCVSDGQLKHGGTLLAHFQHDVGTYNVETLFSTDSALLGLRGLYNFGHERDASSVRSTPPEASRISAGAELYYGILNSTIGLSGGLRYATLPAHLGVPRTVTVTANPLMGNFSATYAIRAGPDLTLASRFDFNAYSYESDVVVGCELWRRRRRRRPPGIPTGQEGADMDVEWAERKMGLRPQKEGEAGEEKADADEVQGVLKARVNQHGCVGLLWEGRVKELLFSLGETDL